MEIKRVNPDNVAPPIAQYHHVTVIPRDGELVVLSGQIGNNKDGLLPKDIETQFANALTNIKEILRSEGINTDHVFKVNIWLTEEIDGVIFRETWNNFHHQVPPATTLAYVKALARPEIKVEVEAWAAR